MKLAIVIGAFNTMCFIMFAITLSPPPLPAWALYRTAIFFLYGTVHIFVCLLHFFMGLQDSLSGQIGNTDRGFSFRKTLLLSILIFVTSVVAFSINLVENRGVGSYDSTDEDYLKFSKRHSAEQMRRMLISLNAACLVISIFLVHNLAKMVSRPAR